jgi:hypothetical protein
MVVWQPVFESFDIDQLTNSLESFLPGFKSAGLCQG